MNRTRTSLALALMTALGVGCGAPDAADPTAPTAAAPDAPVAGRASALSSTVTVKGNIWYNDLRQYGRFEWRSGSGGAAGTQHDYDDGHRSNKLGLWDATVDLYEVDTASGTDCTATSYMGSTTVSADGSFSWTGTVSDNCAGEPLLMRLKVAAKISLRYCDSAGTRCFSVRDPGTVDDSEETQVFSRWHSDASASSPRAVPLVVLPTGGNPVLTLADESFQSSSVDGTLTDLDAQAANIFASMVDATRAFHVNDSVPFRYSDYGEVYAVYPTLRTTAGSTYNAHRFDLPAGGTGGGSRTPTAWVSGNGVMHEYGHIIHFRAFDGAGNNTDYSYGGNSSWSASSKEYPQSAFTEGWANFVVRATLDGQSSSATTDPYGCTGSYDSSSWYGCSGAPCNDGHWYPGNVTRALCDWMDSANDVSYGDGDHFAASSLYSMWYNLENMYDNATAAERSAGLDLCDWVDYYVNVRQGGSATYQDLVTDLIWNNAITCN